MTRQQTLIAYFVMIFTYWFTGIILEELALWIT